MKVLLSAYACEPGKGSEPGVGWNWANGLASRVDLHVLTRQSNRSAIENALASLPDEHPLKHVEFHYHDLSGMFLWAKKRGFLPTMAYYILWQFGVARRFAKLADQMDVVHHLTFCTLLCPGFWKLKHARFCTGPTGAPLVNPHYLPLFGRDAWRQQLRNAVVRNFHLLPGLRRRLNRAAGVVPANSETRELLISRGVNALDVILDTGAPASIPIARPLAEPHPLRLLHAGQLEQRKGLEISLRALAWVSQHSDVDWRLDLFGKGPDEARLRNLAKELHLEDRVIFHGSVPRDELMKRFHSADVFLFTSVRDTSGGVNLEAMANGLPLICIAHQGVGDITRSDCAERIPPGPLEPTIQSVANAVIRLATDPEKRRSMGMAASRRATEDFSWEAKFDAMLRHYHEGIPRDSRNSVA